VELKNEVGYSLQWQIQQLHRTEQAETPSGTELPASVGSCIGQTSFLGGF
jgi:hypothetical protein